jgi:hypothetical protein
VKSFSREGRKQNTMSVMMTHRIAACSKVLFLGTDSGDVDCIPVAFFFLFMGNTRPTRAEQQFSFHFIADNSIYHSQPGIARTKKV